MTSTNLIEIIGDNGEYGRSRVVELVEWCDGYYQTRLTVDEVNKLIEWLTQAKAMMQS